MLRRAVQDAERRLSGGAGYNIHSTAHERPCVSTLTPPTGLTLLILEDTRAAYEILECCEAMLNANIAFNLSLVSISPSRRPRRKRQDYSSSPYLLAGRTVNFALLHQVTSLSCFALGTSSLQSQRTCAGCAVYVEWRSLQTPPTCASTASGLRWTSQKASRSRSHCCGARSASGTCSRPSTGSEQLWSLRSC